MNYFTGSSQMNKKISAGGIVACQNKILFIRKKGKWDFPKGKLENFDTIKKAAVREISEETGLNKERLEIISKLAVTNSDKFFRKFKKEIVWFEVRYDGELHDKLMPDFNEGIDKCMWLNINSKKILDFNFKKRVFELLMIKNNHKNVIKTDLQESFF